MTTNLDITPEPSNSQENRSTLAPSEKHLEDWIVANFPRFGERHEDGFFPDEALPDDVYRYPNNDFLLPFYETIIGRQVRLPSGIPDLLAYTPATVSPIEIKRGAITYDAIGQCLRYMHDLMEAFSRIYYGLSKWSTANLYPYPKYKDIDITEYPDDEITGMVVGHHFQDKNVSLVCAACRIMPVTYKWTGDGYEFVRESLDRPEPHQYQVLSDSDIGKYIVAAMKWRHERHVERRQS